MAQQFNVGDIVRFKPTRQIGVVTEFTDERMVVDFFLDGEDGYVPKSFLDCFELLRAANPNPDTTRLDWMILRDYSSEMSTEDKAFTLQMERENIDTFIRLDAEQGAEA